MMCIKLSTGCIRAAYAHDIKLLGNGVIYLRSTKECFVQSDIEEMYEVA